jgi:hypothetical protein
LNTSWKKRHRIKSAFLLVVIVIDLFAEYSSAKSHAPEQKAAPKAGKKMYESPVASIPLAPIDVASLYEKSKQIIDATHTIWTALGKERKSEACKSNTIKS